MSRRLSFVVLAVAVAVHPLSAQSVSVEPRTARTLVYHPRDIVPLRAKVRYTTLLVLPEGEEVLEATCGDKDVWIINVRGSLVSVKPVKAGSETNLNLVTTTGQVYAFLLTEVSADKTLDADLTIYLEPDPPDQMASRASRKFVPAEQLEDFRGQAELAREQARQANEEVRRVTEQSRRDVEAQVAAFRNSFPLSLRFEYLFEPRTKPFQLQAIFHDGHRTFIRSAARELPAVYEYKDGQPNLVNFEVHEGTYIIPKVVDDGYLMIGRARLGFRRVDGGVQ
jgi:type IV secretion system protein VirB9